MARENRDVRPFQDLDEVQTWLEDTLVLEVVGDDGSVLTAIEAEGIARLDPKTLSTCGHRLVTRTDAAATEAIRSATTFTEALGLGKDLTVVQIVVLATSPFLRFTDELWRAPISELGAFSGSVPLVVAGSPRPRSLSLPHNGTIIEVVVALGRELEPRAGMPHRLGTWLARVRFTLGSPTEGIGFNPIPLTAEKRAELGIPRQTATYAAISEYQPDLMAATMLDDFVDYYVDVDLLSRLSASPRHEQSALVQTQLFLGAVEFTVLEFQRVEEKDDLTFGDVDERLVGKIVRIVSDENPSDLARWFEVLKTDPSMFLAQVEHVVGYRKRLDEAMSVSIGATT